MTSPCRLDAAAVEAFASEPLDWRIKSLPETCVGRSAGEIGGLGLNLLHDWPMPVAALLREPLERNIATMARWCATNGVLLAPHGKTTMAPQLFARQVAAGCFALTCATPWHLRVYRHFGVSRILYANELVDSVAIAFVAAELHRDPGFEFLCLVDSTEAVATLAAGLRDAPRPIDVLVEVGAEGARTGCRSREQALAVAGAVSACPALRLAGVECFEGVVRAGADGDQMGAVDAFLERVAGVFTDLDAGGLLGSNPIVTAGGSAWFDRVTERFAELRATTVLRSGCYVTQDGGFYHDTSPLAGRAAGEPTLHNAIEVWGSVLSSPEPDFCVASFGRRDVPFDLGLPKPVAAVRAGAHEPLRGAEVVALSDQHAHVRLAGGPPLEPGDVIGAVISHPCGVFDRWRLIPVVDTSYAVVDAITTVF